LVLPDYFSFEIIKTSSTTARLGKISTPRGEVNTPAFMPVATQGTVKAISRQNLLEAGAEMILANAYHLYLRPGLEIFAKAGGLHKFMGWERPILTDSGGYQVFSLSALREVGEEGVTFRSGIDGSEHFLSPEAAMEIQHTIGAEIIMSFDEPVAFDSSRGDAEIATERSDRWALRGKTRHDALVASQIESNALKEEWGRASVKPAGGVHASNSSASRVTPRDETPPPRPLGGRALFGIVQGGFWKDLREASAQRIIEMNFDGYAIGGLSVGEPKDTTFDLVGHVAPLLPLTKPRYLMGMGLPSDILRAVRLGIDMLDCVLPTRLGRNGTALTRYGKMNLRNNKFADDFRPLDPNCKCATCQHHSRAYLRHLHKSKEILAAILVCYHNLHVYQTLMRDIRSALAAGRFEDFCREFEAQAAQSESE
jgi:queuine tRNA-ribosyltransferase